MSGSKRDATSAGFTAVEDSGERMEVEVQSSTGLSGPTTEEKRRLHENFEKKLAMPIKELVEAAKKANDMHERSELRGMYSDLDVFESVTQLEWILSVYDDRVNSPDWLASLVQKELSKLEKRERQRLALECLGGLVEPKHSQDIIKLKLRMAIVGATRNCQAQIEDIAGKDWTDYTVVTVQLRSAYDRLKANLRYLFEYIDPYVIDNLRPFQRLRGRSAVALSNLYYKLALTANALENKQIPDYGCLRPLEPFLVWSDHTRHWELNPLVSTAVLRDDMVRFQALKFEKVD